MPVPKSVAWNGKEVGDICFYEVDHYAGYWTQVRSLYCSLLCYRRYFLSLILVVCHVVRALHLLLTWRDVDQKKI